MIAEKESKYLVETVNITKRFGDIVALRNVNFKVGYNEVVGLVGDNGAGKSTLMKIITGVYEPDEGDIYIKGIRFKKLTPKKARELGITIVHQERTVAEKQPLWRNIFMGNEKTTILKFLKIEEMKEESMRILKDMGFNPLVFYPDKIAKNLSGGYKQGIQIARAMHFGADLVIMDEPTIQLSLKEANRVLEFVKALKGNGKSCIFISHNIYHVYDIADRIVIMDRGRIVADIKTSSVTVENLIDIMINIAERGVYQYEMNR